MCYTGLIKRIVPFFLTFVVGLFIASFFVTIATPTFNFRRGSRASREIRHLRFENQELRQTNYELRQKLDELRQDKNELAPVVTFPTFEPDAPPPPPRAPRSPQWHR